MVFNDSIFASPKPSFERPVPLVLVDPWDAPLIYLKLNVQWMPYVLGALRQLVLQSTWDTTDPAALDLVQARAMSLINLFTLALQHPAADDCCHEIAMTDSRIKWLPANPFTAPNDVPAGYHFPPWYVAPAHTLIPGIQMGDVVTDLLHAPFNPLASGFPRLRISVKGPGTIEVKFIRFPTASIALWTVDGDLASSQWTDLHVTLESAIGRFDPEMVIPIAVTGEGEHVIDLSIIASISEDPPFVHFGGGIRSIALCGFGAQIEPKNPTITEMEYLMSVCEQLQFHNGKLQGYCCGEWVDIAGQSGGLLPDGVGQPGGEDRPPVGGTKCLNVLLRANSQWILPFPVNDGDIITIEGAEGGWTDGSVNWWCPNGYDFVLGACVGTPEHEMGDPDPVSFHMQVIAKVNGIYYPADSGSFTIPSGSGPQQLVLQANDASLSDNSGDIKLKICVESGATPPVATWCYTMPFALSNFAWTPSTDGFTQGTWTAGTGWVPDGGIDGTATPRNIVDLSMTIPATTITSVDMKFNLTKGTYTVSTTAYRILLDALAAVNVSHSTAINGAGQHATWSGSAVGVTFLELILQVSSDVAMDGTGAIVEITFTGEGTNPFGADNC